MAQHGRRQESAEDGIGLDTFNHILAVVQGKHKKGRRQTTGTTAEVPQVLHEHAAEKLLEYKRAQRGTD
jgi:hypothetical protein